MATLTGILVDVSGSMKKNAGGRIEEEGGEWARSIFQVIDDLVKHDLSSDNQVFSVGIGASCRKGIFDVIKTVDQFKDRIPEQTSRYQPNFDDVLEDFYQLVERNGARQTRKWASNGLIKSVVSHKLAVLLVNEFKRNDAFLKEFVRECLPDACKDWAREQTFGSGFVNSMQSGISSAVSTFKQATREDIEAVVDEAKSRLLKNVGTIYSVQSASNIVHGCVDQEKLNDDRIKELMETVKPFIYGVTPLYRALEMIKEIFVNSSFSNHKKLLFVLSDGEPTDQGSLEYIKSMFKTADVTVVGCFITNSTEVQPLKLYSRENRNWNKGTKFLFKLSSTISTQLLPRTIFIKRGWDIDITNNETKLFIQVNHPDNIHDACDLARNVVCCQDALSDLLVSVSLDLYINQSTTRFKAQRQVDGTCYANASAVVLHLAMKRILGRDGGYPDFDDLRAETINRYGKQGANTLRVLQEMCRKYHLRCRTVDVKRAMEAITAKRPVVATFRLTDREWNQFAEFYRRYPTGILTKSVINISKRRRSEELRGHAVVLTSFNSECFRFMNSWGDDWADMGFFRVQNKKVLTFEFIDVFWELSDLSRREKDYYQVHGAEVAEKLIRNLKGLQMARYKCPLCRKDSLVTEFSGSLHQAVCPKCKRSFPSDEAGNILALNMYLLSLTR